METHKDSQILKEAEDIEAEILKLVVSMLTIISVLGAKDKNHYKQFIFISR